MGNNTEDRTTDQRLTVSGDQEAWLKDRIRHAINTGIAIDEQRGVGADKRQAEDAIEGLINGTAVEIVNVLNLDAEGTNLRLHDERDGHLESE